MGEPMNRAEKLEKLEEMIEGIKVAMLTTTESDGQLRSRPMWTQEVSDDGHLWFFTKGSSGKVDEIREDRHVNVSYVNPDDDRYVSVSGMARIIDDRDRMEELWNPMYKAWFPEGLEDPEVRLLQVDIDKAEYWDASEGKLVQLAGFVKSLVSDEEFKPGENRRIDL